MTNNPTEPNFDWVSARHNCSLPNEFERLKNLVEKNCIQRSRCLTKDSAVDFTFSGGEQGSRRFSVARAPISGVFGKTYEVSFSLRDDHILVIDEWTESTRQIVLTVTLNRDGECRFVIDGEGEYLRWQVARRALCPMFFQGASERVVP